MRNLRRLPVSFYFFYLPQFIKCLGHWCEELTFRAGRSREYRMAQGVSGRLRGSRGTSAFRDRSAAVSRGAQFHGFRTRSADLSRYVIIVRNLLQNDCSQIQAAIFFYR